jgi:hypothetical protein
MGQSYQPLVLTGLPPRIAGLPAFLLTFPYAGIALDATAAREAAEAVFRNWRLFKLFLFISIPFQNPHLFFIIPLNT